MYVFLSVLEWEELFEIKTTRAEIFPQQNKQML